MSRPSRLLFSIVFVFLLVTKTWTSTAVQKSTDDLFSPLTGHTTRILLTDDTVLDENFWRSILGEDYKRAVHLVLDDREVHVENQIGMDRNATAANEESTWKNLEKKSIIDEAQQDNRYEVKDSVEYLQKNMTMKRESIATTNYSNTESHRNETKKTNEDQGPNSFESLNIEPEKNENKTVSHTNESQKEEEQSHRPSVIDHNEIYMELKEPVYQPPQSSSQIHEYTSDQKHQSQKRHTIGLTHNASKNVHSVSSIQSNESTTEHKDQLTDRDNSNSAPASVTVNLLAGKETTMKEDPNTPIVFKIHPYLKPSTNQDQQKHLRTKMKVKLSQFSSNEGQLYQENKFPENYNQHSNMFNASFDLNTSTFQSTTPQTKEVMNEKTEPSNVAGNKDSNKELFEVGF